MSTARSTGYRSPMRTPSAGGTATKILQMHTHSTCMRCASCRCRSPESPRSPRCSRSCLSYLQFTRPNHAASTQPLIAILALGVECIFCLFTQFTRSVFYIRCDLFSFSDCLIHNSLCLQGIITCRISYSLFYPAFYLICKSLISHLILLRGIYANFTVPPLLSI